MRDSVRLDLPVLLPGVPDARDACVSRLMSLLEQREGIQHVHVIPDAATLAGHAPPAPGDRQRMGRLCLHYDAEAVTLSQLEEWARFAGAELTDRFEHVVFPFREVGAEDEGLRVEQGLLELTGVTAASVSFPAQVARVEFDRGLTNQQAIVERLRTLGVMPVEEDGAPIPSPVPTAATEPAAGWYARNRELAWSLIAGSFLAAGWIVEWQVPSSPGVAIALFIGAYFYGARDNVGHSLKDLRAGRVRFNIDLLMVVAALGAAILGAWAEGALLLFLFSLGHALEHYALGRARRAIRALSDLAPETATVLEGSREVDTPIAQVRPGARVLVKPGSRFPVDGTVVEGESAVNQSPITGESIPVDKSVGDSVFAGSVNGEGAMVVAVTAAIGDRTLDRVIRLVTEAQTQKAPTQRFTERFERVFVPLVLIGDALLMLVPPLIGVWSWPEAFYRAMVLLVASSPCALALGTPAAVLAGIAQAARHGVLIKGGAHLEALGTINVLALDKTGTITRGEPVVTDLRPTDGITESELLGAAAAVERRSQHPLARAIRDAASKRSLQPADPQDVQAITSRGIRARVDGSIVEVGRLLMFEEAGAAIPDHVRARVNELEGRGRTTVVVGRTVADVPPNVSPGAPDGPPPIAWLGVIGIADEPRDNVRDTLVQLRRAGIGRIVMLTGDNENVGRAVAGAVGVDEVLAGLLPDDKVTAIESLSAKRGRVAMVGDGVNDAPALAHAIVGIAMGGAGTAAALETADIALMADDLGRLPFAIGLSRATRAAIRQNLYLSLGVIAVLIVASVTGVASIGTAVIVHEGSTLVVVANGLRLLTFTMR